MLCHIVSKSQPTSCCCNITTLSKSKFESIEFAPPFVPNDHGSSILPVGINLNQPRPPKRTPEPPFLTAQSKHNRNCGIHVNRLAVEQRWLIAPLANGVHGALHQQRWTGNILKVLDRAVFSDNRMKQYGSGNMRGLCDRRIDRRNLANKIRLSHIASY